MSCDTAAVEIINTISVINALLCFKIIYRHHQYLLCFAGFSNLPDIQNLIQNITPTLGGASVQAVGQVGDGENVELG